LAAQAYGGGPGAFSSTLATAIARWQDDRRWHTELRRASVTAEQQLQAELDRLLTDPVTPAASGDAA
ncbi:MAG: hypothetical protein ABI418_13725, partial [Jatrophihabitantaceae bacterium]